MNQKTVILFATLFILFASSVFAATPEALQVSKILKERTNGNDSLYSKLLSPAKSLDVSKNASDRIQSINDQITREIDLVTAAFNSSAEDKKIEAVHAAANLIDSKMTADGGAHIIFVDQNPSSATARILMLIPKKNSTVSGKNVLNALTSYKRSAKPNNFVYEYAIAENLTSGPIKNLVGSETSYLLPEAATPLKASEQVVLKKCRQLLGWKCLTALYRADAYSISPGGLHLLFSSNVDLNSNPDHADFAGDKRSTNQTTGSTGTYVIIESKDWVIMYSTDAQYNEGKLSFTGIIQQEFQKDFNRLKLRIATDLKLATSDIK